MKPYFFIILACLLCSGVPLAQGDNKPYVKNPVIKSGKSYETCFQLYSGDKVFYSFDSRAELRFNIHYHKGKEVHYPVPVRLVSSKKSVFEAEIDNQYCLMWKNPGKETVEMNLQYHLQTIKSAGNK
ncbi:MAG: hypothetical protein KAI17_24100 [Thiotrichaceae bacterium]|nr:hypothetical protein [Thiotrichaceae bacterium]